MRTDAATEERLARLLPKTTCHLRSTEVVYTILQAGVFEQCSKQA